MKEAIKRLRSIGEKGMRESDYREVTDSLALYRQDLELVLHIPTSDELCKALSSYIGHYVEYSEYYFFYEDFGEYDYKETYFVVEICDDGSLDINYELPPHLITMIGRFYEGLEVKE